jgi:hypothetical protein
MDIEIIRTRVQSGNYLVKIHAVQHALKGGFERKHMVEAILNGRIIEKYTDEQRLLIRGHTTLMENLSIYLHVNVIKLGLVKEAERAPMPVFC